MFFFSEVCWLEFGLGICFPNADLLPAEDSLFVRVAQLEQGADDDSVCGFNPRIGHSLK